MRVTTSDGTFGFIIERAEVRRFFIFQLVIDGKTFGDDEPSIIGSTMQDLQSVQALDLDPTRISQMSASDVLAELQANDEWNDATLRPVAESLDGAQVRSFISGTNVSYLARSQVAGGYLTSMSRVSLEEYNSIVDAVLNFWAAAGALD